ncbi:prolyl oligopeptidase family serine peptidase [Lignipirellula cremea]|uniref:Prolyl oligopeptidase family protein n=1 Tax=Lignipirellula cremea TaxID=2528010 RepID=A0A518E581_9BACT|nr:prolyl oligopeptidase family serine peptidase [Lignipirellula cremea]QDU99249.1 Prolyl oligopeptidase family protein [Lignipirellula cremea]
MMFSLRLGTAALLLAACAFSAWADGPKDNQPDQVRQVPPVGVEVPAADRAALTEGLAQLDKAITSLRRSANKQVLLPDVEIFARAVRQGLEHREFFSPGDIAKAKTLLQVGSQRAADLAQGKAPWTTQTGLVVRGYRSRIDNTVQPYGLVVPESYTGAGKDKYRLDLWFHGRGERSSETVFIDERMTKVGRFAPQDTLVLHPYGRYSNAFKFAGEIDVLEALEHARQQYRVDDDRVAVRGFSMGGAGCWQMAVHYPDLFFAANPGAGFSETAEFLKSFQQEELHPTWYEEKLWRMYDCTGYAVNLFQLPTVAYSGELDRQKQAADIMEAALADLDLRLTHLIGPDTKHAIHPVSAGLIEARLDQLAEAGRARLPLEIRFATYTLKYNRAFWLTVTSLEQHWEQATVTGKLLPEQNTVELALKNISGVKIAIPSGRNPFALDQPVRIKIAGTDQTLVGLRPGTDQSWEAELHHDGRAWRLGPAPVSGLRKQQNLQGPIDDALMDAFTVVRPTGKAQHPLVGKWTEAELEHLVQEWRRQFRGDVVIKRDDEITADDIANRNLILFGDPSSNKVLASLIDKLPIQWNAEQIVAGDQKFDAAHHAPVMIYPNPANPERYVVLNSGFTYREFAYLNNARQVPKLPDWAIVDLRTPADSLWPGRIVDADFFDEKWRIK